MLLPPCCNLRLRAGIELLRPLMTWVAVAKALISVTVVGAGVVVGGALVVVGAFVVAAFVVVGALVVVGDLVVF